MNRDTAAGFDPAYFPQLAQLEARHFWFRARASLIAWALQAYFPAAKSFMEIGCGTGFVLSEIASRCPGIELSGSDLFSEGLAFASSRVPRAKLFQMDARRIPFDNAFDVLGAFDVIEHIAQDEEALGQFHAALKPGGGLLLTVPQHPFLWSAYDKRSHHVRRYVASELKRKLANAGFKVRRATSFVTFLLPLMAMSRRGSSSDGSAHHEMQIGRSINAILAAVMAVEFGLLRLGLDFPFGGSLLVVATKE